MANIELARMLVMPQCPNCGGPVLFDGFLADMLARGMDAVHPVTCVRAACGWTGMSRRTVPQPKVPITVSESRDT